MAGIIYDTNIQNGISYTTINSPSPEKSGGLIGLSYNSGLKNSLYLGKTLTNNPLIANPLESTSIVSSYYDKNIQEISSFESYGRTTSQLKNENTFVDWNFNEIWEIDEGKSYPNLKWLNEDDSPITKELEIILEDDNFENIDDNFYSVSEKINKIDGKILGDKTFKELDYEIKVGRKILSSERIDLTNTNKFTIQDVKFIEGLNQIYFTVTDLNNNQYEDFIVIQNNNKENETGIVKDMNDNDGDGLENYYEELFATDKNKADTDGDGVNDYYEIFITFTDPLIFDNFDYDQDTDSDGLTLREELELNSSDESVDTDGDGLSDYEEFRLGTLLNNSDSDGDSLSDYVEVYITKTDPLNPDTNGNGIIDSEDIIKINAKYESAESEDLNVVPSVDIDIKGEEANYISILKIPEDDLWLSDRIPGYIGNAFDFHTEIDFQSATINFEYENSNDNPDFKPRIYYYNENEKTLELLINQIVSGNKISAKVNHFSTYMLLDSYEHEKVMNQELPKNISKSSLDIFFVVDLNSDSSNPNAYKLIQQIPNLTKRVIEEIYEGNRIGIGYISGTNFYTHLNFTSDKSEVYKSINKLALYDGSPIYNSFTIANSLTKAMNNFSFFQSGLLKNQLILLSSGYDYNAAYSTYNSVLSAASNKYIGINVINTNNSAKGNVMGLTMDTNGKYLGFSSLTSEDYVVEKMADWLNTLSEIEGDKTTDTDGDGIPDYYEIAISAGIIRDSLGRTLHGELDIKNDDTDSDGLKDGDEIEITISNNIAKIIMKSDPTMIDTDGDNIYAPEDEPDKYNDKKDLAPLIPINYIDDLKFGSSNMPAYSKRIIEIENFETAPFSKHTDEMKIARDKVFNSVELDDSNDSRKLLLFLYYVYGSLGMTFNLVGEFAGHISNAIVDKELNYSYYESGKEFALNLGVLPDGVKAFKDFLTIEHINNDNYIRPIRVKRYFETSKHGSELRNLNLEHLMNYAENTITENDIPRFVKTRYNYNLQDELVAPNEEKHSEHTNEYIASNLTAGYTTVGKAIPRSSAPYEELSLPHALSLYLSDLNWVSTFGSAPATMSAEITKKDDSYKMKVHYRIDDFLQAEYEEKDNLEWYEKKFSELSALIPVFDRGPNMLHLSGLAREHRGSGVVEMDIEWQGGYRLRKGENSSRNVIIKSIEIVN